jgi:uncharacterized membrane protein
MPNLIKGLLSRRYLLTAIAFGVVLYFAASVWIEREITRALIGWDGGVILFLALIGRMMSRADAAQMKRSAIEHDEGKHIILLLTLVASTASVGALIAELSAAKAQPGTDLRVALAGGTIVLSWLFTQAVFAVHYAHLYYLAEENGEPKGGLGFGEQGEPDYWDFLHFAIVLGAAAQTADITFTSREMRRVGTLHTLVAFAFNTAILATMINLAAAYL